MRARARDPKTNNAISSAMPMSPSCRFSLQSFTSSYHKLRISAFWRASRTIAHVARARSQNQDPPAVSHTQLTIHAEFHSCIRQETQKRCSQSSLRTLRARLRAMRTLNPETKTLQPSAMSHSTFMPIFIPIRQF